MMKHFPPPSALAAIALFGIAVPLSLWSSVGWRDWGEGGTPAAVLDAPYFWAVIGLRGVGALAMAVLLWIVRRPSAIWVAITAAWLAGPPMSFLLTGIFLLSASGGQGSIPQSWSRIIFLSAFLPAMVTFCLLAFRRTRRHYGLAANRMP